MSQNKTTAPAPSAAPFLVAVVLIVAVTLGAATAIYLNGGGESAAIVIAIFGFVGTSVLVPLYNAYQTRQVAAKVEAIDAKVDDVAVQTDGKLTALLAATERGALAEGQITGAAAAREIEAAATLARAEAAALVQQAATSAAPVAPIPVEVVAAPTQDVRIVQNADEPVPVRQVNADDEADAEQRRRAAQRDAAKFEDG